MLGFTSPLMGSAHVTYSDEEGSFYLHTHDCARVKRGRQCKRLKMSSPESAVDLQSWSNKFMQSLKTKAASSLQRSMSSLPTQSLIRAYSIQAIVQCDQTLFDDETITGRTSQWPARKLLPPPSLSGFATATNRHFLDLVTRDQTIFLPGTAFHCDGTMNELTVFVPGARTSLSTLSNFVVAQVWRPGKYPDPSDVTSLLSPALERSGFQLVWQSPIGGIVNTVRTAKVKVDVKHGDIIGFTTKELLGRQSSPVPFDTFGGFYYVSNKCADVTKPPETAIDYLSLMTKRSAFRTTCFDFVTSETRGDDGRRTYSINADVTCH
uniref:Uncharacterized protein LOC100175229 n=1 Tax=Phallusia mammillata TaxID=59560 RepID=A0A6F9DFH8_9ASCI|nr:uncharacterized protein LOC100175229 [Phallusia mammillata]